MIGTTHGSDADIAHAAFDGAYAAARFTYSYDDASDTWTCPELTSKTAAAATKPAAERQEARTTISALARVGCILQRTLATMADTLRLLEAQKAPQDAGVMTHLRASMVALKEKAPKDRKGDCMCRQCRPVFAADWAVKAAVATLSNRLLADATTELGRKTATREHTARVAGVTQAMAWEVQSGHCDAKPTRDACLNETRPAAATTDAAPLTTFKPLKLAGVKYVLAPAAAAPAAAAAFKPLKLAGVKYTVTDTPIFVAEPSAGAATAGTASPWPSQLPASEYTTNATAAPLAARRASTVALPPTFKVAGIKWGTAAASPPWAAAPAAGGDSAPHGAVAAEPAALFAVADNKGAVAPPGPTPLPVSEYSTAASAAPQGHAGSPLAAPTFKLAGSKWRPDAASPPWVAAPAAGVGAAPYSTAAMEPVALFAFAAAKVVVPPRPTPLPAREYSKAASAAPAGRVALPLTKVKLAGIKWGAAPAAAMQPWAAAPSAGCNAVPYGASAATSAELFATPPAGNEPVVSALVASQSDKELAQITAHVEEGSSANEAADDDYEDVMEMDSGDDALSAFEDYSSGEEEWVRVTEAEATVTKAAE